MKMNFLSKLFSSKITITFPIDITSCYVC